MMGDIINIKDTTDMQLLERFKRLEDIIPECMKGVPVNPFIQHIRDNGEVSVSLVDFLNHSEFLELLTPNLLLISQELFDKKADTEWYKIMLSIIEEKDDIETFCENIPFCVENEIDCEVVRDMVEKSDSSADLKNALDMYIRERCKDKSEGKEDTKVGNGLSLEYYIQLCKQKESFISQLLMQNEELKHQQKQLSNGLEEATFYSEFASINIEERCKKLEIQRAELEKQYVGLKMDMESVERQLQNALKIHQVSHNRFIDQKRSTLKYQLQAEKLQKQVTDISETKSKCENLEKTIVGLEEEKAQLEGRVAEVLADAEQLRTTSNQQAATIQDLNNSLTEKESEITRLMAQIKDLEEQLSNSTVMYNASVVADPTESQGVSYRSEMVMQETIIKEEAEEVKEFPDSQMISFESGLQSVKRKSNWFTNLIAQHSKKSFLKNSRQDQENMIFIKMMEMRYPTDKVQKVRSSLSENIPCFDLYKLICGNPSIDELDAFFDRYSQSDPAFA